PPRAPPSAGFVDGVGSCGAAPGFSGARLGALRLGEQPAPLLPALGGVHECRELGANPARPDNRPFRRRRDDARLALANEVFVIPAKAGTRSSQARTADRWVPAFAGTTK